MPRPRESIPDQATIAQFLRRLGVTPQDDPGEFDYLQRAACDWWAAGGSLTGFVAECRSARGESLRFGDLIAQLRDRYGA